MGTLKAEYGIRDTRLRLDQKWVACLRFASPAEVLEAGLARLMLDPPDELDASDIAAIDESEEQIARGEDLDWKVVSQDLRRRTNQGTNASP